MEIPGTGNSYVPGIPVMVMAYATGDYTMQEIAMFFGVHYANVSRVVKKHGTAMRDCKT